MGEFEDTTRPFEIIWLLVASKFLAFKTWNVSDVFAIHVIHKVSCCGFYIGNQKLFPFPYFTKCITCFVIWRAKIVRNFTFRTLRHFRCTPNLRAPEVDKYAYGLTLGFSRQISKCRSRLSYLTISVELATTTHWLILLFSIRKSRIWWYSEFGSVWFGYRNFSAF